MESAPLPCFPSPEAAPEPAQAIGRYGLGLRPAGAHDIPFLRALYVGFRLPESRLLPWSAAERTAFADNQFRLQHVHLLRHYRQADFWIVTQDGTDIGRLYLDRSGAEWRLIDILLAPDTHARGYGSALIDWLQRRAHDAGAHGIVLNVALNNPRAHALYQRLGFIGLVSSDGLNLPMRWDAAIRR